MIANWVLREKIKYKNREKQISNIGSLYKFDMRSESVNVLFQVHTFNCLKKKDFKTKSLDPPTLPADSPGIFQK